MNVSENYREICWKKWPNLQVSRIFDVFLSHGGSSRVSDHNVIHWWSRVTLCDGINILDARTTVLLPRAQGKLAENRLFETNIQLARQTSSVYEFYFITRWFNMTCWFLTWRSLNLFLKGHWSIPERSVQKNCQPLAVILGALAPINRVITPIAHFKGHL